MKESVKRLSMRSGRHSRRGMKLALRGARSRGCCEIGDRDVNLEARSEGPCETVDQKRFMSPNGGAIPVL